MLRPASSGALQVRVNLCCDQLPQESRGHDSDLGEEFMAKKLFKFEEFDMFFTVGLRSLVPESGP